VSAIAIDQNDKIVAAGWATVGGELQFALARYNTNGSLDNTFSTDGMKLTPFPDGGMANAVALQSDGKIVAAGWAIVNGRRQFAVARYHSNGSLDTSFSSDGKAFSNFPNGAEANAVAIDRDGKIVAAGYVVENNASKFAVARFSADGSLDTGFHQDGMVSTSIPNSTGSEAYGVAIDQNNSIVAVGSAEFVPHDFDTDERFTLVRYSENGNRDRTFDGDGIVVTNFQSVDELATAVAIDQNNKIVVAGCADYDGGDVDEFVVARYNADGSLDRSFNRSGRNRTNLSTSYAFASGLAIDANGNVVVAGGISVNGRDQFALARFKSDGALDQNFDRDGVLISDLGNSQEQEFAMAVAIDSRGRIVVGGVIR
jgi:uncharacterized delta-60 repeat protein